jgi:hypothetical protein
MQTPNLKSKLPPAVWASIPNFTIRKLSGDRIKLVGNAGNPILHKMFEQNFRGTVTAVGGIDKLYCGYGPALKSSAAGPSDVRKKGFEDFNCNSQGMMNKFLVGKPFRPFVD